MSVGCAYKIAVSLNGDEDGDGLIFLLSSDSPRAADTAVASSASTQSNNAAMFHDPLPRAIFLAALIASDTGIVR
ncbi:hypothetical protein ACLOJK_016508 [Asimina triloba]